MVYFRRAFCGRVNGGTSVILAANLSTVGCVSLFGFEQERHSLDSVSVVTLHKKDCLCYLVTAIGRHETEHASGSRICLLIRVRYPHSTSSRDVESYEAARFVRYRNESHIVREDVDVIIRRYSDSNFKLWER